MARHIQPMGFQYHFFQVDLVEHKMHGEFSRIGGRPMQAGLDLAANVLAIVYGIHAVYEKAHFVKDALVLRVLQNGLREIVLKCHGLPAGSMRLSFSQRGRKLINRRNVWHCRIRESLTIQCVIVSDLSQSINQIALLETFFPRRKKRHFQIHQTVIGREF